MRKKDRSFTNVFWQKIWQTLKECWDNIAEKGSFVLRLYWKITNSGFCKFTFLHTQVTLLIKLIKHWELKMLWYSTKKQIAWTDLLNIFVMWNQIARLQSAAFAYLFANCYLFLYVSLYKCTKLLFTNKLSKQSYI